MNDPIQNIKEKLALAKATDGALAVFGADAHQYQLDTPVSADVIRQFEETHHIQLPEEYKTFMTQIGYANANENAYLQSAAGPYYGILPLDSALNELETEQPEQYLSHPCQLYPRMTDEQWEVLAKEVLNSEEDISDEDYDTALGKLYGGLLPIGTQGCAITTAIVLNGPHTGRIVYFNGDEAPIFAYERHFLDWYERWLDEIISGDLVAEGASWFGYAKGGSQAQLWNAFLEAQDDETRLDCIKGLTTKKELSPSLVHDIINAIPTVSEIVALALLRLATRHNYEEVKELSQLFAENNLVSILQNIYWYAKHDAINWVDCIAAKMDCITDTETFCFSTYILVESKTDFAPIIQHKLTDNNPKIRSQAYYTLGQLANKTDYIHLFKQGLKETDPDVLLNVLQAVSTIKDQSLLPYYKAIAAAFPPSNDNYIAVNLVHCLKTLNEV